MKLKLTLVAIATTFLLTGCGKEGAEPTTSTPSLESQQVDEKNVPVDPPKKTPEIVFDWEEPKEPYYTLGVSPLDAFDLITRYNLEEDVRVKSVFFATEKATTGFTVGDDSTTIYSHDNLQDAPETADDKEAAILGSIVTVGEAVEKKCKKITKAMADAFLHAARIAGDLTRIFHGNFLRIIQRGPVDIARLDRPSNSCGFGVIRQQTLQSGKVMLDAIVTVIQPADPDTQRFKKPFRNAVAGMMKHVFIHRHMCFHRMWSQRMHHHDVVNVVVRPLYPVIERFDFTFCFVIRNHIYPSHCGSFNCLSFRASLNIM